MDYIKVDPATDFKFTPADFVPFKDRRSVKGCGS